MNSITDLGLYCCFSYLGPFWLAGLFSERRHNRLLRFHMNQGIVLFISELVLLLAAWIAGRILGRIPAVGGLLRFAVFGAALAYAFAMSVLGMSNVLRSRTKELPLIGWIKILR